MDLSGKIDDVLMGVFRDVSQVTASLGIPFFVVGATARDIVLEHGFDIKPGRATRDLDFGVRVADMEYAGARLLGRDMAAIAQPETVRKVLEILEKETQAHSQYRLVAEMPGNRVTEAEIFEYHLKLLQKLKQGVSEAGEGG